MRHTIWEKDDFFSFIGDARKRIDMDPVVVECKEEPIPLTFNYNWEHPPIGQCSDIRVENGELTCVVEWFGDLYDDWTPEKLQCRLGGYYTDVFYANEEKTVIEKATLRVHLSSPLNNMPGFPKIKKEN